VRVLRRPSSNGASVDLFAATLTIASCSGKSVVDREQQTSTNTGGAGGEGQCTAAPVCEPGDEEVAQCTDSSEVPCYPVTVCGTTIYCLDTAGPDGCPTLEPVEGDCCDPSLRFTTCEYETPNGCTNFYICEYQYPDPSPDLPTFWLFWYSDC
jgi:hypothetical protein